MQEAGRAILFSDWSDDKIRSRYEVLKHIEEGAEFLTDGSNPLVRMSFPNGFDPVAHPTENIDLIRAEANRRGVSLT